MPIEPIEPHLARWSLRRRILGLAAVVLLALLAVSIAVVLVALRTILTQSAAATARGQSYELARLLEDGVEPAEAVREVPARGAVLQVLGAQGSAPTVLAASEARVAGTSLVTALPATGRSMDETTEGVGGDGDTYAVAAQTVMTPDGVRTAVAARQLEVEFRTVETSTALLGVGGLVLGLLLLVLVDRIVRGALAPVTPHHHAGRRYHARHRRRTRQRAPQRRRDRHPRDDDERDARPDGARGDRHPPVHLRRLARAT